MAKDIIDSALAKQFLEYLEDKGKKMADLSETELKEESKNFLNSKYPGFKDPPNKLVELMASPSAEKALESSAIVNPEDDKTCNLNLRKKREIQNCPNSTWYKNQFGECYLYSEISLTFHQARDTCKNLHPGAHLQIFTQNDRFEELWQNYKNQVFRPGVSLDINNNKFWMDAHVNSQGEIVYNTESYPKATNGFLTETAWPSASTDQDFCVVGYPRANTVNSFFMVKRNCVDFTHKFFCVIDGIQTVDPFSVPKPSPNLPQFPCFAQDQRKKREIRREKRAITCPTNWYKNIYDECLIFVNQPKSFTDAQTHCTNLDPQSTLMVFTEDTRFINLWSNLKNGQITDYSWSTLDFFWLESQRNPTTNKFEYLVDGNPQVFNSIYFSDRATTSPYNCVKAVPDGSTNYKFFMDGVDCSTGTSKFFCQKGAVSVTANPPTSTPAPTSPIPNLPKFPCGSG